LIALTLAIQEQPLPAVSELIPANPKAFARYIYARVPGAAHFRFALKDMTAKYVSKQEFSGVKLLALGPGPIVDVGANRGQSVAAFRRLAPEREVIAFEPEPRTVARLRDQMAGVHNVTIHECALGRSRGRLSFFIPRYGMWDCDGMAATNRQEATLWLRDDGRMFRFNDRLLSVEEHSVECRTLDSFNLSPALIKLHAQGAESDILAGAVETLRRSQPALMCAFVAVSPQTRKFLEDLGYQPFVYDRGAFVRGVSPPDITFTWFLTEDAHRRIRA
jgi:FkbM family methyltransferase